MCYSFNVDIREILNRYSNLMAEVDKKVGEIFVNAPEIPCKNKCYECCQQLFPVSFVEAYYVSEGFKKMDRSLRRNLVRAAEKISRKINAEQALQFEKRGVNKKTALNTHAEFAKFLHKIKCDCPALDIGRADGACALYEFRNHDCRSMGASFDASANAIVGCHRFSSLGKLIPLLMDFGYLYPEKLALDREIITAATAGIFTPNIFYYTTMCSPILKDYAETDWIKFFADKALPMKSVADECWVIIDV